MNKISLASLEGSKGIALKHKYNSALLKLYIEYANEEANAPDRNYKERFDNVPDKKPRIEVVEQSIQEKKFLGHFAQQISWENSTSCNRNINLQRF